MSGTQFYHNVKADIVRWTDLWIAGIMPLNLYLHTLQAALEVLEEDTSTALDHSEDHSQIDHEAGIKFQLMNLLTFASDAALELNAAPVTTERNCP